jgi:hypothetical protein
MRGSRHDRAKATRGEVATREEGATRREGGTRDEGATRRDKGDAWRMRDA